MTNKMPVVGNRYKHKEDGDLLEVSFIETHEGKHPKLWFTKGTWLYLSQMNDYEELPEDKLQEKEEVNEGFKVTMSCAYCHQELKEIDGKFQSNCECYKQNGYVSSKSHIEKEEVSEVERALEAEKQKEPIIKYSKIGDRAIAHYHSKKIEPEIDMKEECVEPVSIWKDVSELPKVVSLESYLIRFPNNSISIASFDWYGENYINPRFQVNGDGHIEKIKEYATLTDLINSFEQMQKDIAELKRK